MPLVKPTVQAAAKHTRKTQTHNTVRPHGDGAGYMGRRGEEGLAAASACTRQPKRPLFIPSAPVHIPRGAQRRGGRPFAAPQSHDQTPRKLGVLKGGGASKGGSKFWGGCGVGVENMLGVGGWATAQKRGPARTQRGAAWLSFLSRRAIPLRRRGIAGGTPWGVGKNGLSPLSPRSPHPFPPCCQAKAGSWESKGGF